MIKGWSPFGFIPDLLSGKDPKEALTDGLKTAALTAAVVGTGGTAAPAVAGVEAATPIASGYFAGATPAELLAANGGSAGASGGGLLGSMSSYAQPAMQALSAANSAQGLLSDGPQAAPQVPQGGGGGSETLAQLYQQGVQMTPEDQERMKRKTMWG